MSEYYYETQPAAAGLNGFVGMLRAMDPDIVPELSVAALQAQLDHQKLRRAVYWLVNNDPDPQNYAHQRMWHEEQATKMVEEWKPNILPTEVAEIIDRYIESTPVNEGYRS